VQQFSASLSQYKMKRFGGFKVAKVLRELQRGKQLVSENVQLYVNASFVHFCYICFSERS